MPYAPWSRDEAILVLTQTSVQPGPVLISLQAIQSKFGYVPPPALALVADACNVSRAEVHGVFTFYSDFRATLPPEHHVRVCVAEACQSVGSRELINALVSEGIEHEDAFCFGNCALGPSVNVNGVLLGRANVESIKKECES